MNSKNKKINYGLILLAVLIFQFGCRLDKNKKDFQNQDVSKKDVNSDIYIFAPNGWNSHLIGEPISFMIEVIGNEQIIFSKDYGIEIFMKDQDEWIEVDLVTTKYAKEDIILHPSDDTPRYSGSIMVIPILDTYLTPLEIRAIIFGYKFIDGVKTDQLVAAYTDIWLFPKE